MIMTRNQHDWPPELEATSACSICGLLYGEWDEDGWCTSSHPPNRENSMVEFSSPPVKTIRPSETAEAVLSGAR
jgi:hypothetical protein